MDKGPFFLLSRICTLLTCLARSMGLEPTTSPVTGERSNQLNYERILLYLSLQV